MFNTQEIIESDKSKFKTLNKDILLKESSNGTWDFSWNEHDLNEATELDSLQCGIINACLTSWNYMNRYGNPTYSEYGNRAYAQLKQNKSTMNTYKIKVFFEEALERMRRIQHINELTVTDNSTNPHNYDVYFNVTCINNEVVEGELTISENNSKNVSLISVDYTKHYITENNPLIVNFTLYNEYGSYIENEHIHIYVDDVLVDITETTNRYGEVSYTFVPNSDSSNCCHKLKYVFKNNGYYEECSGEFYITYGIPNMELSTPTRFVCDNEQIILNTNLSCNDLPYEGADVLFSDGFRKYTRYSNSDGVATLILDNEVYFVDSGVTGTAKPNTDYTIPTDCYRNITTDGMELSTNLSNSHIINPNYTLKGDFKIEFDITSTSSLPVKRFRLETGSERIQWEINSGINTSYIVITRTGSVITCTVDGVLKTPFVDSLTDYTVDLSLGFVLYQKSYASDTISCIVKNLKISSYDYLKEDTQFTASFKNISKSQLIEKCEFYDYAVSGKHNHTYYNQKPIHLSIIEDNDCKIFSNKNYADSGISGTAKPNTDYTIPTDCFRTITSDGMELSTSLSNSHFINLKYILKENFKIEFDLKSKNMGSGSCVQSVRLMDSNYKMINWNNGYGTNFNHFVITRTNGVFTCTVDGVELSPSSSTLTDTNIDLKLYFGLHNGSSSNEICLVVKNLKIFSTLGGNIYIGASTSWSNFDVGDVWEISYDVLECHQGGVNFRSYNGANVYGISASTLGIVGMSNFNLKFVCDGETIKAYVDNTYVAETPYVATGHSYLLLYLFNISNIIGFKAKNITIKK